ncbi:MAG: VWA domain-containing protein [Candidatus Hadarchaeum sp.]|uniref:vWA domain-containing protein n=1 Tax=Candidatus Hadarchaeum sp. TaxID=2883567 RepID=UPI00317C7FAD
MHNDTALKTPGGVLAARPLHLFFVADCSGSMQGDKIQSLNQAIREAVPHMREVAKAHPEAEVIVGALRFATGAQWHIPPTPVDRFEWVDLAAGGVTDMGQALKVIADELGKRMPKRALPPVIVLVSDGQPTDDFDGGLNELMNIPWGKKAVRIAIAIGKDADESVLSRFVGNPEIAILHADNPEALVHYIRWASTQGIVQSSQPKGQTQVPQPPPLPPSSAGDVW